MDNAYVDLHQFINADAHLKATANNLFLLATNEVYDIDVSAIKKKLEFYKIKHGIGYNTHLLILNSWYKKYNKKFKKLKINVVYVDLWLKYTYEKLFIEKLSAVRTKFCYNKNNSFLFMMGKFYRPNRIRLFYKLLEKNCIKENTFYTLRHNSHKESFTTALRLLDDVIKTKNDLKNFFTKYKKEIDVEYDATIHTNELHYTGIPYNVNMFLNSNFQIIAESSTSDGPLLLTWITEKTWISIANKMPFILVGGKHSCLYLENLGFKTFREYMKYPDYDEHDNLDTILDQVVENVQYWEYNLHKFKDNIENDVEHNFRVFEDRYFAYLKTQDYICKKYNIDKQFLNNEILAGYTNHYPVKINH